RPARFRAGRLCLGAAASFAMPGLARQGQTAFHAPTPPAWEKAKFATSHLRRDAPRDDGYYWMEKDKGIVGFRFALPNLRYFLVIKEAV
ncbi:MAG: hypothetical protein K9K34_14645, partial [Desulfarculaceae bacterium]|nr:hypothetical protein [Desulfarculaceae bacterium]